MVHPVCPHMSSHHSGLDNPTRVSPHDNVLRPPPMQPYLVALRVRPQQLGAIEALEPEAILVGS